MDTKEKYFFILLPLCFSYEFVRFVRERVCANNKCMCSVSFESARQLFEDF